ncbi:MAG: hypothetical protein LC624_05685 [Halobacteriales archaeon]|nr:hypothetical protein [Halobacteriales archaeon]
MRLLPLGLALATLLAPVAGALPVADAQLFEGQGGFVMFELGRSFPECIPHPSFLEPLPGDLRVALVHAPAAGRYAMSFTFTHLDGANPLGTCLVHETCLLAGDPRAGRVLATCARDALPQGYVELLPDGDGSYAFTSFLGLPVPGGGADLLQGKVTPTQAFHVP